jgi:cytochrome c oxidase assembly factor CtaG
VTERLESRSTLPGPTRTWLAALGVAIALVVLVPMASLARRHEVLDALQFAVLAIGAPALIALGAPSRLFGPVARRRERFGSRRREGHGAVAGVAALAVEVAIVVAWRTTGAVGAIGRHHWLVWVEAATLVVTGVVLWSELVDVPPLVSRTPPGRRIVLASIAMWTVWAVAYVAGMSHGQGYPGFHHVAGHGLSGVADKQLATAVLWAAAALAYLPVVFVSLSKWLHAEERRAGESRARLRRGAGARPDEVRPAH